VHAESSPDESAVVLAREGTRNLVANVARVQKGQRVLILAEYGKVESPLVDLIADEVKTAGAEYHVLWAEPLTMATTEVPPVLMAAISAADMVIYTVPAARGDGSVSIVERFLDRTEPPHQVINNFTTVEAMGSDHARMPFGVVSAIYDLFEETCALGKPWRITTPTGTDIHGTIGIADERRLAGLEFPYRSIFPHRVHRPIGSDDAEGVIVVEACSGPPLEINDPPSAIVEGNQIVRVEGGPDAAVYQEALDESRRKWGDGAYTLDSWHGGLHPYAPDVPGLAGQGCVGRMHFHVGKTQVRVGADLRNYSLEVDGKLLIDQGRLVMLDDPEVKRAVGL
jgi:hypothetical protein